MDNKNIHIINSTIDNPLFRFFISSLGFCETCHQKRIEVALELFIGNRSEACVRCSLAAVMLTMVLAISSHVFGVDNEELKKRFRNPYWRKGLINVLSDLRNRDKFQDECGSCKYKYFCNGFRARAYGYTKDYLAADSGCIRNKKEHKIIAQKITT